MHCPDSQAHRSSARTQPDDPRPAAGIAGEYGSLLLEDRQGELPGLMRDVEAHGVQTLSISLSELVGEVPAQSTLVEALRRGFEQALGIRLTNPR